jgi:hypothetical protein
MLIDLKIFEFSRKQNNGDFWFFLMIFMIRNMFMLYTIAKMNESVKKPLEVIRNVPSRYWTIDVEEEEKKNQFKKLTTNLFSFHLIVETFDGRNFDRFSNFNVLWIAILFHYKRTYTWRK